MPRLYPCVSEEHTTEVEKRARKHGFGVSRYLAEVVRRDIVTEWPRGFFDSVVGERVGESRERPPQREFECIVGLRLGDRMNSIIERALR